MRASAGTMRGSILVMAALAALCVLATCEAHTQIPISSIEELQKIGNDPS